MAKDVLHEEPEIGLVDGPSGKEEGGNKVKKVTKKPAIIQSWMWFGATLVLGAALAAIIIALA